MTSTYDSEILNELYSGRKIYHGELHDHACTGGTSDGKRLLSHWKGALEALDMDFAAILDHRQVRHMYEPDWEDGLFICGTEPGTVITDSKASRSEMHYNMLVPSPEVLMELLSEFQEYHFTGGQEGHFRYPYFTVSRFRELIERLQKRGGFFVHPHPCQLMQSDDPLDYWFADETGLEVFTGAYWKKSSLDNYKLWISLLDLGKRVWATAGGDGHSCCSDAALTSVYAKQKSSQGFIEQLRTGDFACGPIGIRMSVGKETMGGCTSFEKSRLRLCIGDFHKSVRRPENRYRMELRNETEAVVSRGISCEEPFYYAMDTENCKFYRVEVFDETRNLRIGIGNPIWNTDRML